MKLKNLKRIFHRKHIGIDFNKLCADSDVLKKYLPVMFPDQEGALEQVAKIEQMTEDKTPAPKKAKNPYTVDALPGHVTDYDWLVQYAMNFVKSKDPKQKLDFANVSLFVKYSEEFDHALEDYIQRLIRANLDFYLHPNDTAIILDK